MLRLNVGSCDLPLPKPWINIDISTSPHIRADLVLDGRKLDEHFGPDTVDEIYAGHFVEHLTPLEAFNWIAMCHRLLRKGGNLCFTTPDFRYVVRGYLEGDGRFPIEEMEETYLFSYKQESRHASFWDAERQQKVMKTMGFMDVREIDRMEDDRLAYPAEWQVGVEGTK